MYKNDPYSIGISLDPYSVGIFFYIMYIDTNPQVLTVRCHRFQ